MTGDIGAESQSAKKELTINTALKSLLEEMLLLNFSLLKYLQKCTNNIYY